MRQGNTGDWKAHLSPHALAAYEVIAGRAMALGGYAPAVSAAAPVPPFPIASWWMLGEVLDLLARLERELKDAAPGDRSGRFESIRQLLWGIGADVFRDYLDLNQILAELDATAWKPTRPEF
jgi:hypothetical protein